MAVCFWVFTSLYIYTSNASPITTFSSLKIMNLGTTQQLHDGETLVSQNQRFELGFFCPSTPCKDTKYLGIWYKNIAPLTVVWVANRRRPARRSSSGVHLVLNDYGVLIIQDASKRVIWRKAPKGYTLSTGRKPILQLLDSGNLVLRDCDNNSSCGGYMWESFDLPGDTLLPGMELSLDYGSRLGYRAITSWRKKDDPSDGDFMFGFDKLVQAPQLVLTKENGVRLSRWGPWDGQKFSGMNSLMDNPVLSPTLRFDDHEVSLKFVPLNKSMLLRFVLSPLGSLEFLWWKSKNDGWLTILTLNKDNCDRIGSCGSYGICYSDDPSCRCLEQGFMAISSVDWCGFECSSGCKRKHDLNCSNGDGFLKYEQMKLPDNSTVWGALSTKECENKCAKECNCMAYTSLNMYGNGSICVAWLDDLNDLRVIHGGGNDLYIRMSHIELDSIMHKKKKKVILFVAIVFLSTTAFVLLVAAIIRIVCMLKKSKTTASVQEDSPLTGFRSQEQDTDCYFFDLDEIATATSNWSSSNEIGEGGFGRVYKGQLARGEEVAVKRLAESSWQGIREFKNEVTLIAKLQHRNLVKLLGYCMTGNERILVYEYLPNHSLDQIIFDQIKRRLLMWDDRFKIIKGVAKGLLYLHDDSRLRIIHRDLKASNILLDRDMNPKISDFGLARILASEKEETTNQVIGTHGYMPPEYLMNGHFSTKSDVYSFGVLVLEIISGKKNWGFHHPDHNLNLLGHAWKLWTTGRPLELMDPVLVESNIQEGEVMKCMHIGLLCVQKLPENRPTMSEVVNMQQGDNFVTVRQPDEPGFYAGRSLLGIGFSTIERELESVNDVTMTALVGR
ncbi:hypothetical protein L1987_38435 [Smallanthus sonchifolius]|uniref:Uncharacterized protein n=1 Tax=Smallanthus sonchifolius TaxID=185202 RepID=A0ACB9HKJ0_9ASTR|nr:hypothetical protein L1987_38435 [Smallanthus sonchifolius]